MRSLIVDGPSSPLLKTKVPVRLAFASFINRDSLSGGADPARVSLFVPGGGLDTTAGRGASTTFRGRATGVAIILAGAVIAFSRRAVGPDDMCASGLAAVVNRCRKLCDARLMICHCDIQNVERNIAIFLDNTEQTIWNIRTMSIADVAAVILAVVVVIALILTVLIITLMAVGYARGISYWNRFQYVRYPRKLLSEARPRLKTGDIVLFIASVHGFTNSMLSQDLFSHVAMIIEIDGTLFLSESTQGTRVSGLKTRNGSDLVPLDLRLEHYCGQIFLMSLEGVLTERERKNLIKAAKVHHPYPSLTKLLKGCLLGDESARHCFQHIGFLLDRAELTPGGTEFTDAGYIGICKAVTGLPGVMLGGHVRYATPVEIVYDVQKRA